MVRAKSGESVCHADSPCGASAHARTKKLHICKCNFVTERRVYLREKVLSGAKCRVSDLLLRSRNTHTAALAKKISQKDFLRRGAASVSGVLFGEAEQSQTVLRRDEPLCEKFRELLRIFA